MNRNTILVNIKSLLSKINSFICVLYIALFSCILAKRCWFIHYAKKHDVTLAMPGSTIYLTIVGMANNTASLKDIMHAFPELSMFDILNALEKGAREGYLNASFGKAMLTSLRDSLLNSSSNDSVLELAQSTIQNVNTAPIRKLRPMNVDGTVPGELPKGHYTSISAPDPITEEIKHVSSSIPLPDPVKETSWTDWIIPIAISATVIIVIGGIIYYIYKKRQKTPPTDGSGSDTNDLSTSDTNDLSTSDTNDLSTSDTNDLSKITVQYTYIKYLSSGSLLNIFFLIILFMEILLIIKHAYYINFLS